MNEAIRQVWAARGELAEAIPLAKPDLGVMSGILLCMILYIVLLVMVQSRGKGLLPDLLLYFFREKDFEQLVTKRIAPHPNALFCALLLSFFSLALFLVFLSEGGLRALPLLFYLGILFAAHALLLGTVRLLGWMFRERAMAREISINIRIYNCVPGVLLAPAIFPLYYVHPPVSGLLTGLLFLLLSLYALLRWARWAKILFRRGVPILYLILYLCGLEILPLLVLYKMLAGGFS